MQCNKATKKNIIIATDKKDSNACIEYNFQSLMTSKLLTGTDRVCAVAKYKADYYINVQGDK